jgi:nucleotide-binding universal stress UspA family protein
MFEPILVPVDNTKRGAEAIAVAIRLAERFNALLILLRVEDAVTPTSQLMDDNLDLERRAAELRQRGLRVRHTIEFGRPDECIAELAQSTGARLIILAPHHRSLLEALRSPSVTARLLGHAATPMLIWPEVAPGRALATFLNTPSSQIVVPLDGSPLAEQALPLALGFVRLFARPLLLVRAVVPQVTAAMWPETYGPEIRLEAEAQQDAESYLAETRSRLEAGDATLVVRSSVVVGQPDQEIKRCAETHDGSLVIMSTHGRSGIQRALLGSVAARLARDAVVPVLVVPPASVEVAAVSRTAGVAVPVSDRT